MAKAKITRKVALDTIITFARTNGFDDTDVLEVVDNMLTKLSTTPKSRESKAHYQNAQLLEKNLFLFQENENMSAREFANAIKNFPVNNIGRPSIHKATAVLVQGVNDGILKVVPAEKKSQPARYALKD